MRTHSLLAFAHELLAEIVQEGDHVIDATMGNGHDTLYLGKLVGSNGKVDAFDVQQAALESTERRLREAGCFDARVALHQCAHQEMDEYVKAPVTAIVLNLGYLPNADKEVITHTETTLLALEKAKALLKEQGLLTVMCYPGHSGGDEEAQAVITWFSSLARSSWNVVLHRKVNLAETAPFLISAYRMKS